MELKLREVLSEEPVHHENNIYVKSKPGEKDILVSMRFSLNEEDIGEIQVQLYTDPGVAPLTHNFLTLALAKKYNNTSVFRMKRGYYLQAGDTEFNCGLGGLSAGGGKIYDHITSSDFSKPFRIAMINTGPHSTASQFFITLDTCSWLDGWFGAFGSVVAGIEVLDTLQKAETGEEDKVIDDLRISEVKVLN